MADIASVALKYTADTSGYISSLRGAAAANRDFASSVNSKTQGFAVPDMSGMTLPLNEMVRLLRESVTIQDVLLNNEQRIEVLKRLQAEQQNRINTAQEMGAKVGGIGMAGGFAESASAGVQAINAETSAFARAEAFRQEKLAIRKAEAAARHRAAMINEEEWANSVRANNALLAQRAAAAAETQSKVAAINAKRADVQASSRYDLASPFEKQAMATQRLNMLLRQHVTITDEVERAKSRLAITQQVATVRDLRESLTAGTHINTLRNLGNTTEDSLKSFKRFQLGVTNAGYQVQDFFVQVASGQSKMTALAQQLPQLLGSFGVFGALSGAAVAIGALAYRLYSAEAATLAAAKAAKELNDAWDGLSKSRVSAFLGRGDESDLAKLNAMRNDAARAEAALNASRERAAMLADQVNSPSHIKTGFFSQSGLFFNDKAQREAYLKWEAEFDAQMAKANIKGDDFIAQRKSEAAQRFGASLFTLSGPRGASEAAEAALDAEMLAIPKLAQDYESLTEAIRKFTIEKLKVADVQRQENLTLRGFDLQKQKDDYDFNKKSAAERFMELDKNLRNLSPQNDEERQRVQELLFEKEKLGDMAKAEADAIRDQIDPMRARNREMQAYRNLVNAGFLDKAEVQKLLDVRRMNTMQNIQQRMPESLRVSAGSGFSYGQSVGGRGADILDLTRRMLYALEKLVELERYDLNPI